MSVFSPKSLANPYLQEDDLPGRPWPGPARLDARNSAGQSGERRTDLPNLQVPGHHQKPL